MKRFLKPVAVSATLAIFGSCLSHAPAFASVQRYSDRQVFEGVLFGQGPVAAAIPMYNSLGFKPWDAEQQHAAALLETQIEKNHPHAVAQFATGATSGDPGKVSQSLDRAAREFRLLAQQHSVKMVGKPRSVDAATGAAKALLNDVVTTTDSYTVVVVVSMEFAQYFRTPQSTRGIVALQDSVLAGSSHNGDLMREQLVTSITRSLGQVESGVVRGDDYIVETPCPVPRALL